MELFILYLAGCFATSFVAVKYYLVPIMRRQEALGKVVYNKSILVFTFVVINALIAPVVFLCMMVPPFSIVFEEHLEKGLFPYKD